MFMPRESDFIDPEMRELQAGTLEIAAQRLDAVGATYMSRVHQIDPEYTKASAILRAMIAEINADGS